MMTREIKSPLIMHPEEPGLIHPDSELLIAFVTAGLGGGGW